MIISRFPSGGSSSAGVPQFTYTGNYKIITDAEGWRVKFLSSGTLTMLNTAIVDVFLVGGGGTGSNYISSPTPEGNNQYIRIRYGAGGGAGYTLTQKELTLSAGSSYTVTVGLSGQSTSIAPQNPSEWGGETYTAAGGESVSSGNAQGGDGGSGGAGSGFYETYPNGSYYSGYKQALGGSDGGNGANRITAGGTGQGTTTREFGSPSGDLYASGGKSVYSRELATLPPENSGDGGCGGAGYAGASGIVIIRNTRA